MNAGIIRKMTNPDTKTKSWGPRLGSICPHLLSTEHRFATWCGIWLDLGATSLKFGTMLPIDLGSQLPSLATASHGNTSTRIHKWGSAGAQSVLNYSMHGTAG